MGNMPLVNGKNHNFLAYGALSFGILSIGFSALLIRWANAPGVVSSFYRMSIGALIMVIPFVNHFKKRNGPISRSGVRLAVAGGFFFSLDLIFWSTGIGFGGATIPTLFANTAPFWVGLGSWVILKEKLSSKFWLGSFIAMIGASLIFGANWQHTPEFGLGALLGAFSAVFYGAFHLISQRGREYLDTISYYWISTAVSAIFLLLFSLIFQQPMGGYDTNSWILFVVMGINVQVIGWVCINFAQGHIPATIVSPTMLIQPVMTAFLAAFLLNEILTPRILIGGFVILLGVYLVHRGRN
jgi:drug/metabolite transporter (DMT)-like permease